MAGALVFPLFGMLLLWLELRRLKRSVRILRKVVDETLVVLEAKLDGVMRRQASREDDSAELQRILPPLREALQTLSRFNQTY